MKVLPKGERPYIKTDKRPGEILADHYQFFVKHYRAWQKCEGSEAYMAKAFTPEERKLISGLNKELLYSGYRVDEILGTGEIKWFVATVPIVPEIKVSDRKIPVERLIAEIGEKMPEGESG